MIEQEDVLTQVISEPQMAFLTSTSNVNLFLAGVGSGKTFLDGVLSRDLITRFPGVKGGIFANTYDQLNTSTLYRIREYWESTGISEWTKENPFGSYVSGKEPPSHWTKCRRNFDRFNNIISFCNGGLIFTGSLDNAVMHSGKEMGWAILDETKDSREEDVKEIILTRLRQKGMYIVDGVLSSTGFVSQQYNPLFITTSPAKTDWINEWFKLDNYIDEITSHIYSRENFFQKVIDDKFITISSTYHNVHNVGENYINNILQNNTEERGKALVYANPFTLTGGEFYSSFDRLKHVGRVSYNPDLPIHISFDQNSVPYNSAGIAQIVRDGDLWQWRFIDEIALVNPRNSTEEVCEEFVQRYPNHKSGIFFYGDASGHNRTTMNKDFSHHYEIIAYKLRRYLINDSDRTLVSNPSVVLRRDFINKIFEGKLPIKVVIDESCHYLISDLMYCKQALDGGKDKHVVTDKETGDKYQKYGHFGDCFVGETMIMTDCGEKAMRNIEPGDKVLTRNGYRNVIAKQHKGLRLVNTYQIGNREIICTDDHKIYANGEFNTVASLIDMNINTIFARKATWKEKLLSWMGTSFINTQKQRSQQTGIITKVGLILAIIGEKYQYIAISGKRLMAKFQRNLQYIISMGTLKITELRIYILSVFLNTWHYIINHQLRSRKMQVHVGYSNWQSLKQWNGINQRLVKNGIEKIPIDLFIQKNIQWSALIAARNLSQTLEKNQNIAQGNVNSNIKQEDIERKVNIKKKESANGAEEFSRLINGIQINSVHVPVSRIGKSKRVFVYDITVEQDHEFFANGVLVHNCFEYMAVELFKTYYNG